jgi:hypothetical protein
LTVGPEVAAWTPPELLGLSSLGSCMVRA